MDGKISVWKRWKVMGSYLLRKKSSRRSKPVFEWWHRIEFWGSELFNCAFLISDMVFFCVFPSQVITGLVFFCSYTDIQIFFFIILLVLSHSIGNVLYVVRNYCSLFSDCKFRPSVIFCQYIAYHITLI